jgi:hypothetical protein
MNYKEYQKNFEEYTKASKNVNAMHSKFRKIIAEQHDKFPNVVPNIPWDNVVSINPTDKGVVVNYKITSTPDKQEENGRYLYESGDSCVLSVTNMQDCEIFIPTRVIERFMESEPKPVEKAEASEDTNKSEEFDRMNVVFKECFGWDMYDAESISDNFEMALVSYIRERVVDEHELENLCEKEELKYKYIRGYWSISTRLGALSSTEHAFLASYELLYKAVEKYGNQDDEKGAEAFAMARRIGSNLKIFHKRLHEIYILLREKENDKNIHFFYNYSIVGFLHEVDELATKFRNMLFY